jgi:hypothetical protein
MSRTSPAKTGVASRWHDDPPASLPDSISQNYSDLMIETSHISNRENLGSHTAEQFVTAVADTGYKQALPAWLYLPALPRTPGNSVRDGNVGERLTQG